MELPNWINTLYEPFAGLGMTDEDVHSFLGDDPFNEWNISENFNFTDQTIGYLVNYSMALALQHIRISADEDAVTIWCANGDPAWNISWDKLTDDIISRFDGGDDDCRENLIYSANKFRLLADRLENKASEFA